jgi:hypothetical protein
MDNEKIFFLIYMIITGVLNDEEVDKKKFRKMLKNNELMIFTLCKLENKLLETYSGSFIIELIRENYKLIKDDKESFTKMCAIMDENLKKYGR